ncbi:alpha/beta fold hydrolase [Streptomyces sp. NPDC092952]|uniref:alpha/beta fold hydrolase n=1 Tax=Streptomyces sp. NPDC092952 TaxID=3366018 RepID=UPI00380FD62A
MAWASVNGIRIHHESQGAGEPVLMVMGSGSRGRVWDLHQVPALTAAGYRVITFDHRGVPPTDECADGFTLDDMVADTAALVEHLGIGPCLAVGTSLGAQILQELMLARPELISRAVLMATRARTDTLRRALSATEIDLHDSGLRLPPRYAAVIQAIQNLSPRTLADGEQIQDWLDLFEVSAPTRPGGRVHMGFSAMPDRTRAYRAIDRPCQVIAFGDDMITPPHLGEEVADAIPGARFELIQGCGHYGYLEDPKQVNKTLIEFLRLEG